MCQCQLVRKGHVYCGERLERCAIFQGVSDVVHCDILQYQVFLLHELEKPTLKMSFQLNPRQRGIDYIDLCFAPVLSQIKGSGGINYKGYLPPVPDSIKAEADWL